jgi:hypothetical protein
MPNTGPYVHHAGTMCAIWKPCGSQMGPCGRQMAPYGSCMATRWGPYGSGVRCMGATCAIWEPDGAVWEVYAAM